MSEDVNRVEERLRSAIATEEVDLDALMGELAGLPVQQSRSMLEKVAREQGVAAIPTLEKMAGMAAGGLAVAAAQALGLVRDVAAANALQRLTAAPPSGGVSKAARRALHRLASVGVTPVVEAPRKEKARAAWPVYKAIAGPIDGSGSREVWFGFQLGTDVQLLALLLNEEKGIVDALSREESRAKFDREVAEILGERDWPAAEMPADYCRHLVEEAHARNPVSGTPIPLEYLAFRDRIGRPEQVYDRPLVYSVINAAEVRWDPRYLDRSGDLLSVELFRAWALRGDELDEFVRERATAQQAGVLLAGMPAETRERMAVDRAIQKLFDARRRTLFKRRLEEMAYLLWAVGRADQARMALASALGLEPPDRSLLDNAFVRALVEWSLDAATEAAEGRRARTVSPGVRLHLPY